MRARVSTAIETAGRSSDRVNRRSVCRWASRPKPSLPRSSTLARTWCAPYRRSSASVNGPSAHAVALARVGGQLQAVLVHRCAPISATDRGGADAGGHAQRHVRARAVAISASSVRRCDSSIHVENVVSEPIAAVPAITSALPVRARPVSRPSTNAPLMLTANVPIGKRVAARALTVAVEQESRDRARAADEGHGHPGGRAHASTRTRRTPALATQIAR